MKSLRLADILTKEFLNSIQYQDLWETLRNSKIYSGEFEHPYKKGIIYSKDSYAPIIDVHGDPYKVLCFINDISDQKVVYTTAEDPEKKPSLEVQEDKKKDYDFDLDDE